MTNKVPARKLYVPVMLFFIVVNGFLLAGNKLLQTMGIEQPVAIIGNLILFIATMLSLYLYQRAMTHVSTQGFLRNAYSGLLVKLVICLVSVAIYAMVEKANLNRQGVFACVFFYFIYSVIEMRSLMRWNKERTSA